MVNPRNLFALLAIAATVLIPVLVAVRDAPVWVLAIACGPLLLVLQWNLRPRDGWHVLGPHFYYDLIRMARKGRTLLFRVLFLLAMLAGIAFTYEKYGIVPVEELRNQLARFNSECVYVFFLIQNLAILMLAPAY